MYIRLYTNVMMSEDDHDILAAICDGTPATADDIEGLQPIFMICRIL